jgi:hypothetical protein
MRYTERLRACAMVVVALLGTGLVAAQGGDPGLIEQKLQAQIKLTRTTADRTDVVTAGDIVQIHKPGIVLFAVDTPLPPTNVYKGGRITQGFGTQMQLTNQAIVRRRFVQDEKCWVTRIVVQNDGVEIDLYSDPYNDVRYYGALKVAYPDKKTVPPVDSFLQTVAEVITVAPTDNQAGQQGGQQAPAPAQAAPAPIPAPAPAPMQAIAPPPPPADAPPPTIALGQTKDQVTAGFGQPTRIAKLGTKEIYYYKDMKVTFTNGKVSNVE